MQYLGVLCRHPPLFVCSNDTKQSGAAEASLWSCPQEEFTALLLQVNQPLEVIEINPSSWFCLFQDGVLPGGGDGLHKAAPGADLRLAAAAFPRCHPGVSPSSCSFLTLHLWLWNKHTCKLQNHFITWWFGCNEARWLACLPPSPLASCLFHTDLLEGRGFCVWWNASFIVYVQSIAWKLSNKRREEYLNIPVCMHAFFLLTANTSAVFVLILMLAECLILLFDLEFVIWAICEPKMLTCVLVNLTVRPDLAWGFVICRDKWWNWKEMALGVHKGSLWGAAGRVKGMQEYLPRRSWKRVDYLAQPEMGSQGLGVSFD